MKKIISVLLVGIMVFSLFVPYAVLLEASAKNVELSKSKITIVVGQTYALKLNGTKKAVTWSSSDKNICSVSKKGIVKGLKKGSATISAKVGKKTYKCKVTVEAPKISASRKSVKVGNDFTLKLNGTKRTVKWYTSDKKIASVSKKGVVKAHKVGKVKIYTKLGGQTYSCTVTVTKASKKLTKKEMVDLFRKANELYAGWLVPGSDVRLDYNDVIMRNGMPEYARVVSSKYKSVSDLENAFEKYFSKEIYKEYLASYYVMKNGKMYAIIGIGEGGDVSPVKYKFTVNKLTDNYCKFTITSFYDIAYEPYDTTYEMKKVNGRWLFVNQFLGKDRSKNIKWVY